MTFFNIIVHGVPDGQKVWSSDPLKQKGYIDAFYQSEPGAPETLFQVEARVEGNERVCYYHYLKYRNIQEKNGRSCLYFGFTLRIDALCADLPLLFHHMDEVFGTLPQFPGAKQKYGIVSLEDFSVKQAVLNVLSKGYILCLSPDVPRSAYIAEKKQLQDLLEQKDAQREALLKQEQEKSHQEIATLRDKNNELSHEVARLRDNEKQLFQKVKAKEEILRQLKDFRKDMSNLLQNLAIYLGKGGAQKLRNDPTPPTLSSDVGEQSEDITGDKDNKADRLSAFLIKNKKVINRLLIFFVAIVIAFCIGRYSFPYMPSDRDDSVESPWTGFRYMNPVVGDSVVKQDSTVKAEKIPSKKAEKKHDNSENSDKKADTTNKGSKKSSEQAGKSSSAK